MTSRGWRATQETKPLRLPAIKSDAGIFHDLRGTISKFMRAVLVMILEHEYLLELDPF
jgi:hypothetical protein